MSTLILILEILAAIFVFGVIIVVHEAGHFAVAKWTGVRVNEFSVGMGPKIFQKKKGETTYSLRWLPIGGYCAMEGEDDDSDDPRAFSNKPCWKRILVVIAGATMNFVLAFVLLIVALAFCMTAQPGEKKPTFASVTLSSIDETSPAYDGGRGLRTGDTIVRVDGKSIFTDIDLIMLMQSDKDGKFDFVVRREVDGKQKTVHLNDVQFRLVEADDGTRYLSYDFTVFPIKRTVLTTVTQSAKLEFSYTVLVWRSLGSILKGEYGLNELSGPVGTTEIIADAVDTAVSDAVQNNSLQGVYAFLMLVVLISVNVGLFNLLPLPALDGGRLLFLLIELVARKPVPQKYEALVHTIGFVLLILLSIVIAFSDVFKIVHR